MGATKQAQAAQRRLADADQTEDKAISPAERLPTAYDTEGSGIQVSTTVPPGFVSLFDDVVRLMGYSRSEAIREGMRLIMRVVAKDSKMHAYILAKLEQRKVKH